VPGLYWEPVELEHLRRFLDAVHRPALQRLPSWTCPSATCYGRTGAWTGRWAYPMPTRRMSRIPARPQRPLLAKAILWCHLHGVAAVALAPLEGNPFPDATPPSSTPMRPWSTRPSAARARPLRPYHGLARVDVLRRRRDLHWSTRSRASARCAGCTAAGDKCAERPPRLRRAACPDRTPYASEGTMFSVTRELNLLATAIGCSIRGQVPPPHGHNGRVRHHPDRPSLEHSAW